MEEKRYKIIVWIMLIGLILFSAYIINDKYNEKSQVIFNEGITQGQMTYSTYLFNNAVLCNKIPIGNGNQTITLIALECLQGETQ